MTDTYAHLRERDHHGKFLPGAALPADFRFNSKVRVDPETGCHVWQAGLYTQTGYAQFFDGQGQVAGHTYAYERAHGPVPEALELDHLCRNRKCVNPEHLEAVTHAENVARGVLVRRQCPQGHSYDDPANVYWTGARKNHRVCRPCAIKRVNDKYHRLRPSAPHHVNRDYSCSSPMSK